jgi:hypothetical protein
MRYISVHRGQCSAVSSVLRTGTDTRLVHLVGDMATGIVELS